MPNNDSRHQTFFYNDSNDSVRFGNPTIQLSYDLKNGMFTIYKDEKVIISDSYSMVQLKDGTSLISHEYATHELLEQGDIEDDFGRGRKLAILSQKDGSPKLLQSYYIYEKLPYLLAEFEVESNMDAETNFMAPLVTDGFNISCIIGGKESDLRSLFVPFDNDKWVRYQSNPIDSNMESYEVTALYDNTSRKGVIIGSISHDTWKTGIKVTPRLNENLCLLVYGGAASEYTRDTLPHGFVKGKRIRSPKIFVGLFHDYRRGLEEFGKANAVMNPPLEWKGGVPFGWNSWSAVGSDLNYDLYIKTSDFFKDSLQNNHFENNGVVYINFDSFWDRLSEEQLVQAVNHVHGNGQKAGIYFTPFACWSPHFDQSVPGTNNGYTWRDLLLKDCEGNVLPELDGGFPLDPTHPGTLQRIRWQLRRFVEWDFDYVKLDFMGHGALEGVHYNPEISTGIQAYNYGMKEIAAQLDPEVIGRPFFIHLSIAPIFPAHYAHSRRISCDTFGKLNNTEYMLNSLSYGWWMDGTIYNFNDPDHTVIYKSYNEESISEFEAVSRFNASVIAGTVLLGGDNFMLEEARNRAKKIFTNEEVNNIAKKGISFIPVEGNSGNRAVDCFFLHEKHTGEFFVAVFNFDGENSIEKNIKFSRLGLAKGEVYKVNDLWSKQTFIAKESIYLNLKPAESVIIKVTPENKK